MIIIFVIIITAAMLTQITMTIARIYITTTINTKGIF